jgi:uncharacterized protein
MKGIHQAKNVLPLVCLMFFCAVPHVMGADFDKGLEAAQKGDFATALDEWKPLAEEGYSKAQYNIAIMYDNGQGVPQDYEQAFKWYAMSAEQGYVNAQLNLAGMYYRGEGVPQDYKLAYVWVTIALKTERSDNALNNRDMIAKRLSP